jgi:hypothetical protein
MKQSSVTTKYSHKSSRMKTSVEKLKPETVEEIQSIENELSFDHLELMNVWGRYKPIQNESCDDKLDRLGKIVGNLKSIYFLLSSKPSNHHGQGKINHF